MLQKFPAAPVTNVGHTKELQAVRLATTEPERRTMELKRKLKEDAEQDSEASPEPVRSGVCAGLLGSSPPNSLIHVFMDFVLLTGAAMFKEGAIPRSPDRSY
ncbi:hypothetical protein CRENBAI_022299 [Crenichthys baileyi]|uniref:Uncharacterized protein n=1 Tax=Crenichthys baileyi TaxID=28760 RepID=A0AAV9SAM4_9TELE